MSTQNSGKRSGDGTESRNTKSGSSSCITRLEKSEL